VTGYLRRFVHWAIERPPRGSVYPPKVVISPAGHGRFPQDGHKERLQLDGSVGRLQEAIRHDHPKDLTRWPQSQVPYAELEAQRIEATPFAERPCLDRRRGLGIRPLQVTTYAIRAMGCPLDGRANFHSATQHAIAEVILAPKPWERW